MTTTDPSTGAPVTTSWCVVRLDSGDRAPRTVLRNLGQRAAIDEADRMTELAYRAGHPDVVYCAILPE